MKFFFALLGVALAVNSRLSLREGPLASGTEYRFRYEGSLISGIPQTSSQSSLTRLRSEVTVQIKDDKTGILVLRKPEMAMEKSVPTQNVASSDKQLSMSELEKRELTKEHEDILKLPMRFHYRNGIVSELVFHERDLIWSENIKRAVVNMLQVNLNKASSQSEENQWENGVFQTMEKTIEGECEMTYTVVAKGQNTQVTKSVNFEKCERRVDSLYNQRYITECPECDYKMITPQTVYNIEFEGKHLKEVEVRSVHSVSLKQQPLMRTITRAQLSLLEKKDLTSEIQGPRGETEELIYNPEWERQMEEFFKLGDESEKKPFEEFTNTVEHIEKFVNQISELPETNEEAVHLFSRLVRTFRMCTEQQLKRVHEKVERSAEQKMKTIIEHALAVAGTRNTIKHLFSHAQEISPMKLAQLLKSVQETPYPSHKIAELIKHLAESRQEPVVRQSAWLAYGAVVRGCVVPTLEKQLFEESREKKEHFISTMERLWEKSETVYDKVLALKTIANAGIPETVRILEKVIKEKDEQTIVRMEAIDALRQISRQIPHRIQKILMPVYFNRMEKNEVRMAALNQLLQAQPGRPELLQIVSRMEREPNQHIAAFTFHMLSTLAESPLPAHRNLSTIAATLIRSTQFRPESRIFALYKSMPLFNEEHGFGMSLNFGSMLGKDSIIPKDLMVSIETITGGSWHKYLAQVGFSHQNVEILINKVFTKLTKLSSKQERSSSSRASRLTQSMSILKKIAEELNIRPRISSSEEAYAMLYLRYKQMDYAVLPIDEELLNKAIERYIQDGSIDMRIVERIFNVDSKFETVHAGHIMDSIVKMPTIIGVPISVTAKLPTIFVAPGKISTEKINYGFRLRLEAQPQLAMTMVHTMNVWCPLFEHGVKTLRSVKAQLPIDIELDFITKNEKTEIKYAMETPEQLKTLLSIHSRPVSYVKFFQGKKDYKMAEEATIVVPKIERLARSMSKKFEIQGLQFEATGQIYRQWSLETLLLGEPSMELTVRPRSRAPKQIVARLVIDKLVEERMQKPSVEKMLRKDMETEEGEWESRSESSRRQQLEKAIDEMELSRAVKSRIELTVEGTERAEIVLRTEHEPRLRFIRAIVEVKPEHSREWRLKSELEVVLPKTVSSVEELKEQKHREVQILCETKWGSEKVEIVAQLEQSKTQRNLAEQPKQLRGVPAQERLSHIARLNQLKARINYELSPRSQQFVQDYFGLLKAYTYWNNEVKMVQNEEGRVLLRLTSEPLLSGLYNMTVETPESDLKIQNIRFFDMVPTIVRQPKNFLRHTSVEKAECKIEENRVNSFENRVFSAPSQTCYTVAAKDCSAEPRFAVLVKNVEKKSDEKMVKIIYENDEYELEFPQGELKVALNGKKIRESELEENKIEKIGDLCVVDLGELVVRFDGYTVKVLVNNAEMDSLCGLCGNSAELKERKYRNARNEETDDLEDFHASFILKKSSEECAIESSHKKQYKEFSYDESNSEEDYEWERAEKRQPKSRKQSKDSSSSEEKKDEEYDRDVKPVERTYMQEHSGKVCFSLEPQPACPKGYEIGKPQEKKIRYGCMIRASSIAREMIAQARRGEIVDTNEITISYVDNQLLPKTCVVA